MEPKQPQYSFYQFAQFFYNFLITSVKSFPNFILTSNCLRKKYVMITYLQCCTKYFKESKENRRNWARPESLNIYFCVIFNHYRQNIYLGRRLDTLLSSDLPVANQT